MMAKRIAQFHKVSFEQFAEGFQDTFGEMKEGELKEIYQSIKLPKRATAGSAGYDFYTPIPIVLAPGKTVKIPTGIRVEMQENWVLNATREADLDLSTVCSLIIRQELSIAIIFTQTMKDTFLQNLRMIPMKERLWNWKQEVGLCRESLWNMELQWMMM